MNSNKNIFSYEYRNEQNKQMVTKLHKAQCAVNKLINTGLTVLDIDLSGSKPVIEIQYQKRCDYLCATSHGRRNLYGRLEDLMKCIFCHCIVKWAQPDYVNQLDALSQKKSKNNHAWKFTNNKEIAHG